MRHTTDGGGTYLATTQSDPFGQGVSGSGSTGDPYLWGADSGYRSDGDAPAQAAPLTKVGARYYDAEFGVFLTRDTELDQKPYAYCNGDPVNYTDPSGHVTELILCLGIGGFILIVGGWSIYKWQGLYNGSDSGFLQMNHYPGRGGRGGRAGQ